MWCVCEYCGHRWDSDAKPNHGRVSCGGCGNNTRVDEAIRNWEARMGSSWGEVFSTLTRFWREVLSEHPTFKDMSPSQLIEWQANAKTRDRYLPLTLAQNWINSQHLRLNTKVAMLSHVRSFFLHNHAEMPSDKSFHFTSDVPAVEGKLTLEGFKRILLNCDKMYRAVLTFMAQTLIGEGELVYVNVTYSDLILESLTKNVGVVKLRLPGRKKTRNAKNFYTMFSTKSDCADALRDYLKSLPELPRGALFRNQQGAPLTEYNIHYYFHRRAVEAGVIKQYSPGCSKCGCETVRFRRGSKIGYRCKECGNEDWACGRRVTSIRYGVNPHEIRDLMRSRWQVSGADGDVADFMMEHEIDPNKYNKFMDLEPWYPVREYRDKALPWLNVLSMDPEKVSRFEVDGHMEALSREVADLRLKLDQLEPKTEDDHAWMRFTRDLREELQSKEKRDKFMHLLKEL